MCWIVRVFWHLIPGYHRIPAWNPAVLSHSCTCTRNWHTGSCGYFPWWFARFRRAGIWTDIPGKREGEEILRDKTCIFRHKQEAGVNMDNARHVANRSTMCCLWGLQASMANSLVWRYICYTSKYNGTLSISMILYNLEPWVSLTKPGPGKIIPNNLHIHESQVWVVLWASCPTTCVFTVRYSQPMPHRWKQEKTQRQTLMHTGRVMNSMTGNTLWG